VVVPCCIYTPAERSRLREALIAAARADARITSAALTGSAAVDAEDEWSDIDLAFAVASEATYDDVLADWTARLYEEHGSVAHVDAMFGRTVIRVFLLASTRQIDLAFWPEAEFGAIAATFRLLFGTAHERPHPSAPTAPELTGMAWLYALHARSSLARGRMWQAEHMLSGVRDHVLALMCVRHGLPAAQGRGMDQLPAAETAPLRGALACSLDAAELGRALRVVVDALVAEVERGEPRLAAQLVPALRALSSR
jgi:predicted nucleotidyltransferase